MLYTQSIEHVLRFLVVKKCQWFVFIVISSKLYPDTNGAHNMFRLLYQLISYVHKFSPKSFQYELAHAMITNKNAATRFQLRADTRAFRNRLNSGRFS